MFTLSMKICSQFSNGTFHTHTYDDDLNVEKIVFFLYIDDANKRLYMI